jgi:hypothetical protein
VLAPAKAKIIGSYRTWSEDGQREDLMNVARQCVDRNQMIKSEVGCNLTIIAALYTSMSRYSKY